MTRALALLDRLARQAAALIGTLIGMWIGVMLWLVVLWLIGHALGVLPAHAGDTAGPIPLATIALWGGALAGFVIADIVKDACGWAGAALIVFLVGLLALLGLTLPAHAAGNAPVVML